MSAKAIYEAKGKELLNKYLTDEAVKNRFAFGPETVNGETPAAENPWLLTGVQGGGGGAFRSIHCIVNLIKVRCLTRYTN